jgi:hypothetical protein
MISREPASQKSALVSRHLGWGWTLLLFFLSLGSLLELMHGFKIGWYLDADQQTRRHLMTLAHAHGALLAIVQIAFAATLQASRGETTRSDGLASACLLGAALLVPLGFLLGGLYPYAGDPGLGVFLVPPGAALLFLGVFLAAWRTWRQ